MKIEYDMKLDFNNVLIRPKRSTISSRSQVDLEREFTFPNSTKVWKGVPIIAANMDTIGTFEVYQELSKHKIITCFHKFYTAEDFKEYLENNNLDKNYYMISTGISDTDFERLEKIMDVLDSDFICIDIANGYLETLVTFCQKVRSRYPDKIIVAGNVVSREMVEELIINGKVDIVKTGIGGGCFNSDTRVLMANGTYKNICDINIGDEVINKNGDVVKVINKINKGIRETYKIRSNNWHDYIFVTPDHNYWIGDLSELTEIRIKKTGKSKLLDQLNKTTPKSSKYKWQSLKEMDRRSVCLMPKNINWKLNDNFKIDLSKYCINGEIKENTIITKNNKINEFNRYISSNYNLGYIFGTFLGDGNSRLYNKNFAGASFWSFGINENNIANKLKDCIKSELNYDCSISVKRDNVLIVSCYNKCFTKVLYSFLKKTEKHLPDEYYCSNIDYIKGLFDGLIDSDGSIEKGVKKNIYSLTNTSKKILELFYWCCMNLNISFSSHKNKKTLGTLKGGCIDNLKDNYRIKTHTFNRFTKDYVYSEIFEKENGTSQVVWDIEVDCPTHSFIANNSIVHNSVCVTRLKTGIGMPQLSCVIECADAAHGVNGYIISDGGITCPADMCKAFGGGADFVMCGGIFSGHDENPGDLIEENGQKYKLFYGMSSDLAMKKHYGKMANYRASEGRVLKVKYRGKLENTVLDYLGGLRSCCTYINAKKIKNIPKCTTFVLVSQQLNTSLLS
jgi:IMP dehydrogenase/GMP reductase